MSTPTAVLVHMVGPLRVDRDGRELTAAEVGSRKGRTLLRLLCAHRPDLLTSAEIAGLLWPADAPADPDAVVASLVSRLRRVLGAESVLGGREGYRLGAVDTDLDRARRLLAEAERQPPAVACAAAQGALALVAQADAPGDEPDGDAAVRAEATGLRRRARQVLARAALDSADPATAEIAAAAALDEDPLDERAARLLMRAQLARGLPAEALRTFDRLRRVLADELGTDPAPETRRLHTAALRGESPDDEPASEGGPGGAADRLRLTGRRPELEALRTAWSEACAHRAGCVVVAGEPGIGKSRLLEALADLARRTGGTVLTARAFEGERSLFAQPVMDALAATAAGVPGERIRRAAAGAPLLARLVPELAAFADRPPADLASSAVERSQNFASVAHFLRGLAREGAVLLVVDDLQKAGRSTVELLHYLARHLPREKLLIAAAVRTGEGNEPLALLDEVSWTLELGPLAPDAVSELVGRSGHEGRAAEVMRRTGGHPLFVVEVLHALSGGEAGLPGSLQAAVTDRVGRLGADGERLLRAAAVLGVAFDPLVAATLAGTAEARALAEFERAMAARLLSPSGRQYEFAHDVVRETLLATTPSPTLLAWHARAADLLSTDPEAVAGHAEAIGDRERAGRAWLQAAERALAAFVASDALVLAGRALAVATDLDDAELAGRARLARGRAHYATARFAAAQADYTAARDAAGRAGDRRLLMTALRELAGDVPVALGRPPADCEPILAQAQHLASELGDRRMEADLLDRLVVLRCSGLDFTGARELAARSLAAGRAAGDPGALAYGLDAVKTSCAYLGLVGELAPVVDELEPLFRRLGDLWMLQWTVFESAFVPLAAGDDGAALERIEATREICRRSEYLAHEPFFLAHAAWVHRLAGRLDVALGEGSRAVDLAQAHRHTWWSTTAASLHAGTLLAAGDPSGAAEVLRPAARVAAVPGAEAYLLRCLAPLAEATGDPAVLAEADALFARVRCPEGTAWLLGADVYLSLARAWDAAGQAGRAGDIRGVLRTAASAAGWPALAALTDR